ncbi:CcdC protein domain-containing protein [Sphingomonas sp.]|uniref:CcdC protein domain-containing protein n=1 Tax=Sphingomonas sp. TaxID=28214 RepID=UPI001D9F29CD|nr:CcdC protein domain-containing protein [Sphingomonas sp.]MBX9796683.1 DUF1453 family protein [Sphingomonas sp.]
MPPGAVSTIILIATMAFVLALRFRRMRRGRRLRPGLLWVMPVLIATLAGVMLYAAPPAGVRGWGLAALGLALGALFGWQRGRMVQLELDPDNGTLNQRESPWALLFIVAIIGARALARSFAAQEAAALGITLLTITDALLLMALGLVSMQRLVLWRRAAALQAAGG